MDIGTWHRQTTLSRAVEAGVEAVQGDLRKLQDVERACKASMLSSTPQPLLGCGDVVPNSNHQCDCDATSLKRRIQDRYSRLLL